jgi:putative DNA primase/helicase
MINYKTDIEPHLRGLWPDVFRQYGIEVGDFKGRNTKNGECPLCGGDDRAHFRDDNGRVSLYCRHCAADSMKSPENVIMEHQGIDFKQFAGDMANYLNLTPIEKREAVKKKNQKVSFNLPTCHKQDLEGAAKFADKAKQVGAFITKEGSDGGLQGVYMPMYNHLQQLVNVAKIMDDGYRFLAGGMSYGAFAIIEGNERVILCNNHKDAMKLNRDTGATVLVTFYVQNLNFCVFKVDGFNKLEVALNEQDKEYFDGFNQVISV